MHTLFKSVPRFLAPLVLLLPASCSLVLDWDREGLPCREGACDKGYSCVGNADCVSLHSVAVDETCSADEQCVHGAICPSYLPLVCRLPCDNYFEAPTECPPRYYCRPTRAAITNTPRGACVADECRADTDCKPPNHQPAGTSMACIEITSVAHACAQRCSYGWDAQTGTYEDDCWTPFLTRERRCHLVGAAGKQRLACIELSDINDRQGDYGPACDLFLRTCNVGSVCVGGKCRPYCDPATGRPCCAAPAVCADRCVEAETIDGVKYHTCTPPATP